MSSEGISIYNLAVNPTNAEAKNVLFNNLTLSNITFVSVSNIYFDLLSKAVFLLTLATYNVTINSSILSHFDLQSANLLIVSAESMNISSTEFTSISSSSSYGFTLLYVDKLLVDESSWVEISGSTTIEGGLFKLQNSADPMTLVFSNTVFQSVSSYRGSIINSNGATIALYIQSCVFTQNIAAISPIMYFNSTTFLQLEFANNIVRIDNTISNAMLTDFLGFTSCSCCCCCFESTSDIQPTIFNTVLDVIDEVYFTAFSIELSPSFDLLIDTVNIVPAGSTLSDTISSSARSFVQLLSIDGGLITLSSLSAAGSPTTYATNMIEVLCNNNEEATLTIQGSSISDAIFESQTASITSSAQYSSFINIIPYSGYFCAHNILVNHSVFSNISFSNYGALVLDGQNLLYYDDLGQNPTTIQLINSNFTLLTGTSGPVLCFLGGTGSTSLEANNCEFSNNYAQLFGGTLSYIDAKISIYESTFISNTAGVYGDVLFSQDGTFDLQAILANNSVTQQIDSADSSSIYSTFSRYPNHIQMIFLNQSTLQERPTLVLDNITYSTFRSIYFEINLAYDTGSAYVPVVNLSPSTSVIFTFLLNSSNQTLTSNNCTSGVCIINGLAVDIPGKKGDLFTITVDYESDYFQIQQSFQVYMRSCIPGEIASSGGLKCTYCEAGTYSFNPNDTSCKTCPTSASCPGGAVVNLTSGYWTETVYSENFVACNDSNDARRCLGGSQGGNCAIGFVGPACYQCDYDNGWYSSATEKCVYCEINNWKIVAPVIYLLFYFAFEIALVISSFRENVQMQEIIKNNGVVTLKPASYIRLLNTYSQIASIISQMQDDVNSFLGVGQLISNPYSQSYFSLSCTLLNKGYSAFTIEKIQIIISLFSPVAKTAVIILFLLIYRAIKIKMKKESEHKITHEIIAAISILVLLEQPSIVGNLASFLTCKDLGDGSGKTYLQRNLAVSCDTSQFMFFRNYVVISGFVLWGAAIPLSVFLILFQNRKNLNKKSLRSSFGSLYNECHEKRYYWGIVIMILKLVIYTGNSLLKENNQTKALTLAQIFIAYLFVLHVSGNPYIENELFECERAAFVTYFATMFYTVYFINSDTTWIQIISLIAIIVINLWFLLKVGKRLLTLYYELAKTKLIALRDLLETKVFNPCYEKYVLRRRQSLSDPRGSLQVMLENVSSNDVILSPNQSSLSSHRSKRVQIDLTSIQPSEKAHVSVSDFDEKRISEDIDKVDFDFSFLNQKDQSQIQPK